MSATPNAMPRKANRLHQQILSSLLDNKQFVRMETVKDRRGKDKKITVVTKTLANNVSDLNIDRAARRWM